MTLVRLDFDNDIGQVKFAEDNNGFIALDGGFETAVLLSLFTDKRARRFDRVTTPRGWWGDQFGVADGDQWGSHLWLLRRETFSNSSIRKAQIYVEECLAWMKTDGLAKSIRVSVTRHDHETLLIKPEITRADGTVWSKIWKLHQNGI